MNIPKREGKYTLKIGRNTAEIDIHLEAQRMNRLDMIGAGIRSRIGGYTYEPKYDVNILDSDGNVIDSISTFEPSEYTSFISSHVAKENNMNVNPKAVMEKLCMKIQREFAYVFQSKFGGIVRNRMKFTYYMEVKDPQDIVNYFDSIGIVCKIAPKKKSVRAGLCWAASVYLPLDFDINSLDESRRLNKRVMRLTESDLRRIVSDAVSKILR
jgi:hypothetical protein